MIDILDKIMLMKREIEVTIGRRPSFDEFENSIITLIVALDKDVDIDISDLRDKVICLLNASMYMGMMVLPSWTGIWRLLYEAYIKSQNEYLTISFKRFLDYLFLNNYRVEIKHHLIEIHCGNCPGNISNNNIQYRPLPRREVIREEGYVRYRYLV